MTCNTVILPDGSRAIVCSRNRRGRPRPCRCCGQEASRQCDFQLPSGRTCDRYLCERCAVRQGPNVDFCPHHPRMQLGLAL